MHRFAYRDFDYEQPLVSYSHVACPDPHFRSDGVGAHLDQSRVKVGDLLPRHPLDLAFVCDTTQQDSTVSISECRDFIR